MTCRNRFRVQGTGCRHRHIVRPSFHRQEQPQINDAASKNSNNSPVENIYHFYHNWLVTSTHLSALVGPYGVSFASLYTLFQTSHMVIILTRHYSYPRSKHPTIVFPDILYAYCNYMTFTPLEYHQGHIFAVQAELLIRFYS